MRTGGIACLISLLLLATAHAAPSSADRARAKSLYESGITHYNLSEYSDALKDFKEAYRLVNEPALLFNIAQCQRQLKDYANAAQFYRAYRRENPNAANRDEVERLIKEMDEAIAAQRAQQPPTGTLPDRSEPIAHPVAAVQSPQPNLLTATPPVKTEPPRKKTWVWGVVAGAAGAVALGLGLGLGLGLSHAGAPQSQLGTMAVY